MKKLKNNELSRVLALARASGPIRLYLDGGLSMAEIAAKSPKTCNPLGLSVRQLSRIYQGDNRYQFDLLKKYAQK